MDDRKASIAAKIRALLAKTVENGCTEEEAVSAAAVAARLLAAHDLTMDEVELRASPFLRADYVDEADIGIRIFRPAHAISILTETRLWQSAEGVVPVRFTYFGLAHEVQIATYLLAICTRAMRDGYDRYEKSDLLLLRPGYRRSKRRAFLDGMADTLSRRIRALVPPKPAGTGLVVLKRQLVDMELKSAGIRLVGMGTRPRHDLDSSYGIGVAAALEVALDKGLTPPKPVAGELA